METNKLLQILYMVCSSPTDGTYIMGDSKDLEDVLTSTKMNPRREKEETLTKKQYGGKLLKKNSRTQT